MLGGPAEAQAHRQRPLVEEVRVVLPGEADAAEHLDRVAGDAMQRLAAERLGRERRSPEGRRIRAAFGRPCSEDAGARQLEVSQHVGELVLDRLERTDRAIELASQYTDRLHAMIDISDGLGRDASHIAQMSNVQIVLHADRIPCNRGCDWWRALGDGEDYELCLVVKPPTIDRVLGTSLHAVGEVGPRANDDDPWVLVNVGGRLIAADEFGWQHES